MTGFRNAESLASWWLQFLAHGGADHDVLAERECRIPRGKREVGQGNVTRDTEATIAPRQVPENGLLPFMPDDGVFRADRVTRRGSARRERGSAPASIGRSIHRNRAPRGVPRALRHNDVRARWRVAWAFHPHEARPGGQETATLDPRSQVVPFGHRLASMEIPAKALRADARSGPLRFGSGPCHEHDSSA